MTYTPTEWETGDIITAEKLNKIEGAIQGNIKVVGFTEDFALNASYDELVEACQNGCEIIAIDDYATDEQREISYYRLANLSSNNDPHYYVTLYYVSDSGSGAVINTFAFVTDSSTTKPIPYSQGEGGGG